MYRIMSAGGDLIGKPIESFAEAKAKADEYRAISLRVQERRKAEGYQARHFSVIKVEQVYTTSTLEDALAEPMVNLHVVGPDGEELEPDTSDIPEVGEEWFKEARLVKQFGHKCPRCGSDQHISCDD